MAQATVDVRIAFGSDVNDARAAQRAIHLDAWTSHRASSTRVVHRARPQRIPQPPFHRASRTVAIYSPTFRALTFTVTLLGDSGLSLGMVQTLAQV